MTELSQLAVIFLIVSFLLSSFLSNFAPVMQIRVDYKTVSLMQQESSSCIVASFNAYCLAIPNNLLTHTHTHTHTHTTHTGERPITHYAYAREACLATLIDKGLPRSFLCPIVRVS